MNNPYNDDPNHSARMRFTTFLIPWKIRTEEDYIINLKKKDSINCYHKKAGKELTLWAGVWLPSSLSLKISGIMYQKYKLGNYDDLEQCPFKRDR